MLITLFVRIENEIEIVVCYQTLCKGMDAASLKFEGEFCHTDILIKLYGLVFTITTLKKKHLQRQGEKIGTTFTFSFSSNLHACLLFLLLKAIIN